jgi:hypothetical protein
MSGSELTFHALDGFRARELPREISIWQGGLAPLQQLLQFKRQLGSPEEMR